MIAPLLGKVGWDRTKQGFRSFARPRPHLRRGEKGLIFHGILSSVDRRHFGGEDRGLHPAEPAASQPYPLAVPQASIRVSNSPPRAAKGVRVTGGVSWNSWLRRRNFTKCCCMPYWRKNTAGSRRPVRNIIRPRRATPERRRSSRIICSRHSQRSRAFTSAKSAMTWRNPKSSMMASASFATGRSASRECSDKSTRMGKSRSLSKNARRCASGTEKPSAASSAKRASNRGRSASLRLSAR